MQVTMNEHMQNWLNHAYNIYTHRNRKYHRKYCITIISITRVGVMTMMVMPQMW